MNHHHHHDHAHGRPATKPEIRAMLRQSGLRPTRQRMALAEIPFAKGNRHISAESLHEEATIQRVPVSLATIYNTLHQFTEAGLLREVAVDGSKTYFDTNLDEHHHFFIEDDNEVLDIPVASLGEKNFWADELFVSALDSEAAQGQPTGRHHLAFQAKDRGRLGDYRIGLWPSEKGKKSSSEDDPEGFIEVTPSNQDDLVKRLEANVPKVQGLYQQARRK